MSALCRVLAALFVLIALVACDEDSPDTPERQSVFPDVLASEREDCERTGGRWGKGSNPLIFVCYRNLSDANQPCRSGRDCQGLCLARSRTCAPVQPFYGCHEVFSDTGLRQTVCLE